MKHDLNNKRHMMTRNDIQETYGITKHLYQNLVNNKVINTIKIGKHNYHPMEEVDKAIKELEERKQMRVVYYKGNNK